MASPTTFPTRPTLSNSQLDHECYYSTSTVNASLTRHLDEFHEEFKGSRGWLLPSRRSLSWLVYLSDDHWNEDDGGELRYYYQDGFVDYAVDGGVWEVGSHDGNLQVAWLSSSFMENDNDLKKEKTVPVYLDSWFTIPNVEMEPHCILYTLYGAKKGGGDDDEDAESVGRREYITRPWPCDFTNGFTMSDFLLTQSLQEAAIHETQHECQTDDEKSCSENDTSNNNNNNNNGLFLTTQYAKNFYLIEDRKSWKAAVPHEVLRVRREDKSRIALAGWFHEETQ
eukprot:7904813-Ditylum_brightwellii.AAC.1